MDQNELNKMIKENRGILRQLTDLNNRVKKLEKTKKEFLDAIEAWDRKSFQVIEGTGVTEKDIPKIKLGGTDPS